MNTRSGEMVSAQIGKMGTVDSLQNGDFRMADGQLFNIKNDGTQPVKLHNLQAWQTGILLKPQWMLVGILK